MTIDSCCGRRSHFCPLIAAIAFSRIGSRGIVLIPNKVAISHLMQGHCDIRANRRIRYLSFRDGVGRMASLAHVATSRKDALL